MPSPPSQVAEIQGLYGPISLPERIVQRIWSLGDFEHQGLKTESGQPLQVIHPGRWNREEGPDFRGATLRIGERAVSGDVEIHFYQRDWHEHQHHSQRDFDQVVLHVVVFPFEAGGKPVQTVSGRYPETLVLLPYLPMDLESYADDEALRAWEDREPKPGLDALLQLDPAQRTDSLRRMAGWRFQQKVQFVQRRLEHGADWTTVFHQLTLEVLGYRRNRAPMANLAATFAPHDLVHRDVESLYQSQANRWRLRGCRPANHPRQRIGQYQQSLRDQPDWPEAWRRTPPPQGITLDTTTRVTRRTAGLHQLRREIDERLWGGALGGTRLDTWVIDAGIPLLAVEDPAAWLPTWFHWFPGDMPDRLKSLLRAAKLPPEGEPMANGWLQGGWQFLLENNL